VLDGLQQAGMSTGAGATVAEVAVEAGRHFGADVVEPVQEVGAVADRALCSSRLAPDRELAEQAWTVQGSLRRSVHQRLDRRQRARTWVAVGSAPARPVARPAMGWRRWLISRQR
jgi:hypothetical protein